MIFQQLPRRDLIARLRKVPPKEKRVAEFRLDSAFRCDGLVQLNGFPSSWLVHSLICGTEEQLVSSGGIPLWMLGGPILENPLSLSSIRVGQTIRVTLENCSDHEQDIILMLCGTAAISQ